MSTKEFNYTREWTDAEAFPLLGFTKNWENPEDYPTYEPDEMQVRKDMQSLHDEVKDFLNNDLIPRVVAEDATVDAWNAMEQARQEAETSRVNAENARAEAEQARSAAEQARSRSETTRLNAESARQTAESGRQTEEQIRKASEEARVAAENLRITDETERRTSEQTRKTAEQARVTAESGRDAAEKNRASAESIRVQAENARATAEQNRATKETSRVQAESARSSAEATRVAQENARVTAESARVTAEKQRANAESVRVTAEKQRANAETARVEAETARVEAEAERISAEEARALAEQQRVDGTNGIVAQAAASAEAAEESAKAAYDEYIKSMEYCEGSLLYASNSKKFADEAEAIRNSCFDETVELTNNRFDSTAAVDDYYVNPNNGALAANTSYATTGFIPVSPGEVITYQYGTLTVEQGRTIGNMSFLAAYNKNKEFLSGGRDVTSYTVPEGVAYIRFSATGLLTGNNVAVVASAEKTDYEEYGATYHYVLKPEAHNDEHIRDIAKEVIEEADIKSDEVWAAPIVVGVTASRFEFDVPADTQLQEVLVPDGSAAEGIKLWGKNHFFNNKGATVTAQGVTVSWDEENQEFVFNGTTTASGDFKLINPFALDWVPGEKYTMSVKHTGGAATLAAGSAGTTYAWGIFQDNAAKYIRGITSNSSFLEEYSFTSTAYELDKGRSNILYFQCWRPGTVFDNYRVKIQIEKGDISTEWEPYRVKTVAIADAYKQTLYKGMNYIVSVPPGEEITVGQIEDTKTYVDKMAGIKSLDDLPDAVITNAYDKDNTGYETNKFLWNGGVSDNAAYFTTGFIAVDPDTDYAFFGSDTTQMVRSICEYNKSRDFISGKSHQNVVTIRTTADTHFLRVCCYNGAEKTLTVRKGTMATGYTPRNSYKIPGEMVAQDASDIDAYLPKHIYCAVGRTIELYNNQVCLQADKYHLKWHCSVGKALKRKFSITGTQALIGDHTLKLGIYNDRLEEVWAGSTTLHIVDTLKELVGFGVVPIGDSLTNSKAWLPEVVYLGGYSIFPDAGAKITFYGTYPWSLPSSTAEMFGGWHEGRSGFTAEAYIKGATYSYGGETKPNAFWDGEKFSWDHYMKNSLGLYGMGLVQCAMIFLGTNGIQNDNTENAGYIKQMVDTIQTDQPGIKVFVCNTIYRSNQNGIGVQVGNDGYAATSGVWKYNEDKKVMDLMKRLDAMLDGYENLWMVNLALTHDSEYNFGAVETPVNPRAAQTEMLPIESVHPQNQGYYQMADTMYSVFCAAFEQK